MKNFLKGVLSLSYGIAVTVFTVVGIILLLGAVILPWFNGGAALASIISAVCCFVIAYVLVNVVGKIPLNKVRDGK